MSYEKSYTNFPFEIWVVIIAQDLEIIFPHMLIDLLARVFLKMQIFVTFVVVDNSFLNSSICLANVIFITCFIGTLTVMNRVGLLMKPCFIFQLEFRPQFFTLVCNCCFPLPQIAIFSTVSWFWKKFYLIFEVWWYYLNLYESPVFITLFCNLCALWSSWFAVLFTILIGYSFIPVNTTFRCSISWCNNIVVQQTILARSTRFLSAPIFNSRGACAFQLI